MPKVSAYSPMPLRRLIHLGLVACVGLALAGCVSGPGPRSGTAPTVLEVGRVYGLVPSRRESQALNRAAEALGYAAHPGQNLDGLGLYLVAVDLPEGISGQEAIAALEARVDTAVVGVNHAYRVQQDAPTSDTASLSFANAALNWPEAACRAVGPVGLIDTGVDPAAPGLQGARVVSRRFARGPRPPMQHGTDVASVLADPSRLRGVTLYAADVMATGPNDVAAGADSLVRALDWFARNDVRVVNLSLAGPYNKLLDLAVRTAAERDMVLVAAVGNAGPQAAEQFPAAFSSVIAVTAVDARQRPYRHAVRGPHVDIAAPGVDVFVPGLNGGRFVTGTSIAAPFVTARIASDRALYGRASVEAIRRAMAQDAVDLGPAGVEWIFGAGLMQAPERC
ncbi:hypothetical protein JANAI62_05800 [Jannaschia pagri]|uniref:Peptidase S8/S53 domain-containing protein n=1 Tax=Jannaschia pagri TaxID=2829797 RepID=A0ABQ4NIN2_9RHOB|nr:MULTISPECIES: S8 family serine peptidase [unclassified Jannaschia]GIT89936.1 hypothetical protein JANAI61_03940 [Jannaschia sp. AI_61]GIT93957.1 hypothetical protein JANAI62_05800 [Jannaschia sp. AI_62]